MENGKGKQSTPAPQPGRDWLADSWLFCLLGLMVTVIFLAAFGPVFAVAGWWDEYRLRRYYRQANRLLRWNRARQLLSSGEGTFLVEQWPKGPGHVWWVADNLRAQHPDCSFAPAQVLHSSCDFEEGFRLLVNASAKAWWDVHATDLGKRILLVQMPLFVWRHWDEVLLAGSAVAVNRQWTHSFHK
jgi:hypothetical protein